LARCSASRIDVEVELRECFDTFSENKNIDLYSLHIISAVISQSPQKDRTIFAKMTRA